MDSLHAASPAAVTTAEAPAGRPSHAELANAVRMLAVDAVEAAKSGHPGMPMGMADAATVLFTRFLKFDAQAPDWPDRDRFVLSAGHGSMLLYALLHLTGVPGLDIDQLRRFRQLDSLTPGHPEHGHTPGVETTTGPLGQGLANAVGMALAERMMQARFGAELVDHRTWVIAGDGCLMEGLSQEAITLAGHLRLSKLALLWDDNAITIDGSTAVSTSDDQLRRFEAAGWAAMRVNGHDPQAVAAALAWARTNDRPTLIACRTIIGYGAPTKAGTEGVHGAPLGPEETAGARRALGWTAAPFEVPEPIRAAWRAAGSRGAAERGRWLDRLAAAEPARRADFERALSGDLPEGWREVVAAVKRRASAAGAAVATRKASQDALEALTAAIPELVGGSADLTHSNLTLTKALRPVTGADMSGRYIHYGVREFAMAAVMNGLALHGGLVPYGGTFLVFADYMRNGIRMAALMGLRVVYVLTHDSIGLGEDGPTHQPVEQVAGLRASPNLLVFRPADAVETAECWELALGNEGGPSALCLSRQALPTLRREHTEENRCAAGAYVLAEAEGGERRATLIATGSEVAIAMQARERLQADGVPTAVVSMPCWELFARQATEVRRAVLRPGTVRVAVEALGGFGWERWVGEEGAVVAMPGFGASAPAPDLYRRFGITAEAVVEAVRARL
ncbi:transketolase [Azospirillum sp. RWY-5-1]|uniref:Transketolase n=1 Tax=Azospirillum oleiclasticum TaxID=2735135 RepID=A0ABX2T9M5_9PROT|nr:transketolase [Azospirillum oleiclasticum]NYZ12688.1 transketolase [Azospirillum oleiclasticum]NYZ19848.1 transketolase [Azospirillum oleiclasticum]